MQLIIIRYEYSGSRNTLANLFWAHWPSEH